MKIGSECNEVRRIKGESTLGQINIFLLPALDLLTVVHDPHHPNVVGRVMIEVEHRVVVALDIVDHILNLLDHSAKVNQDVAVQTASPEVRNLVLIFRKVNAHVAQVASMNIVVIAAIEDALRRGLPLLLGESLPHLGAPAVEHLFRTQTKFAMLSKLVRLAKWAINVSIHIHYLLLLVHLAPDLIKGRKVNVQQTALRLSLFARGLPLP